MKARDASLVAKILAAVILVAGHALMWTGVLVNATSPQICGCCFSLLGIFGTVDINLMLEKFAGGK